MVQPPRPTGGSTKMSDIVLYVSAQNIKTRPSCALDKVMQLHARYKIGLLRIRLLVR